MSSGIALTDNGEYNCFLDTHGPGGAVKFACSRGDVSFLKSTLTVTNTSGTAAVCAKATGESNCRSELNANGRLKMGSGSGATDVNINRVASSTVLVEAGTIFGWQKTNTPAACNSTAQGAVYMDTSLNELCFCNGTNWCKVSSPATCTSASSCD